MDIKNRLLVLLTQLHSSKEPLNSEYLSSILGLSSKTIRADMNELNHFLKDVGAHIVTKAGSGYRLDIANHEKFNAFYSQISNKKKLYDKNLPQSFHRAHFIVRKLLTASPYILIDELTEQLFSNRTTVTQDLIAAKKSLLKFDIQVLQRPKYGLYIEGAEHNRRMALMFEYQYYETNNLLVTEVEYAAVFDVDAAVKASIMDLVIASRKRYIAFSLSVAQVNCIVNLFLICAYRNQKKKLDDYDEDVKLRDAARNSHRVSQYLIKTISDSFGFCYTQNDRYMIGIVIASFRLYDDVTLPTNQHALLPYYTYAHEIIDYLSDCNALQHIRKDKLLEDQLAMHMSSMVIRLRHNVHINFFGDSVLTHAQMAIDLAVQASEFLKNKYSFQLDEQEINYLATVLFPVSNRYRMDAVKKCSDCFLNQ